MKVIDSIVQAKDEESLLTLARIATLYQDAALLAATQKRVSYRVQRTDGAVSLSGLYKCSAEATVVAASQQLIDRKDWTIVPIINWNAR